MDQSRGDRADAIEGAGITVAEGGILATTQDCGHPAPVFRELPPSHCVHTAPNEVQAPPFDAVMDRVRIETELQQLAAGNDSMLSTRQLPNRRLMS